MVDKKCVLNSTEHEEKDGSESGVSEWAKKNGMPLHPNLVNLKSNTMKNTRCKSKAFYNMYQIFLQKNDEENDFFFGKHCFYDKSMKKIHQKDEAGRRKQENTALHTQNEKTLLTKPKPRLPRATARQKNTAPKRKRRRLNNFLTSA